VCVTSEHELQRPCRIRGSSDESIFPKFGLFKAAVGVMNPAVEVAVPFRDKPFGGPRFTWFGILNASKRNCGELALFRGQRQPWSLLPKTARLKATQRGNVRSRVGGPGNPRLGRSSMNPAIFRYCQESAYEEVQPMLTVTPNYTKQLAELIQAIQHLPTQPDYSQQLKDIAHALNRPATPQWIIILISAGVGFISASLGPWVGDFYKRYKLRRVLYRELVTMFSVVDDVMSETFIVDDYARGKWQNEEVKRHLRFGSQDYMKANHDLYISLAEHSGAEVLYGHFHAIIDEWHSFHVNVGRALRMFARAVKEGWLKRTWLWVFLSRRGYNNIMNRVEFHWNVEQNLQRSLEPSGELPPDG